MPQEVVGYKLHPVGLSNQTLALLGLICFAKNHQLAISVPRFVNLATGYLDPWEAVVSDVAMSEVFSIEPLMRMLDSEKIEVVSDRSIDKYVTPLEMFKLGFDADLASRFESESISTRYWNALRPVSPICTIISEIESAAFDGQGIQAVVQLRVEPDMKRYHDLKRDPAKAISPITYQNILEKTKETLPSTVARILLSCDESQIPLADVKHFAKSRLGLDVAVKSDFMKSPVGTTEYLARSIIDFYIGVNSDQFVGARYSTFSSAIYSTKIAESSPNRWNHYAYDYNFTSGTRLRSLPREAKGLPASLPNVAVMSGTKYRPIRIQVHVGGLGDIVSEYGWVYSFGEGRRIEGFSLDAEVCRELSLVYKAKLHDKTWTSWGRKGEYVGTLGQGKSLTGFSCRRDINPRYDGKFIALGKFTSGRAFASHIDCEAVIESDESDFLSCLQFLLVA